MASSAYLYLGKKTNLGKYIRGKKISLAAKDLIETNQSIMEITLKYGFSSQQTFTRIFSEIYGLPPLRYRNLKRVEMDAQQAHSPQE